MHQESDLAGRERIKEFRGALRSLGHDASDFDIREDESLDLSSMLGVDGSLIIVRRRSTGEEHSYATGAGSAWFGALLMDMAHGRFAAAAR